MSAQLRFLCLVAGVLVILALASWMANDTVQHYRDVCLERWKDAGYASRWKDGRGCQVEFEPDRWIDEGRIKIELKEKQ